MLSLDFKDAHSDTDWKVIVAMRHFLVHGVKHRVFCNALPADFTDLSSPACSRWLSCAPTVDDDDHADKDIWCSVSSR